jgi:hypothetical protein
MTQKMVMISDSDSDEEEEDEDGAKRPYDGLSNFPRLDLEHVLRGIGCFLLYCTG